MYSVLLDGHSYQARIAEGMSQSTASALKWKVRDAASGAANLRGGTRTEAQNVKAPMPGKVVRVLVAVGDMVEAGQGIVVVEAMKMQNELKAPRAGKVTGITAKVGATVKAGEVLAVLIEFS